MSEVANIKSMAERSDKAKNLVLGLGETGLSVARYLARNDIDAIYVDTRDEPPGIEELCQICPGAEVILGTAPEEMLKGISRIIASPGIADSHPFLATARDIGIEVISDIQLFVTEADAPLVAVTGSNGKSTVTTLLALMCDRSDKLALAGANLGVPALDLLIEDKPDFYILELSSFQLQRTQELPVKIAVLLNISSDHLDWHASEHEYRQAKYRIFSEAESAVFNRIDVDAKAHLPSGIPSVSFGLDEPKDDMYGLLSNSDDVFLSHGQKPLISVTDLNLVGIHNQANCLAALAAGQLMGLEVSPMLKVLTEFSGLPHRMQIVGSYRDVQFINDSKATNVDAAIASVHSIQGGIVLIAGGQGKGGNFDHLARSTSPRLRAAVLIGEDAPAIEKAFTGLIPTERALGLSEAVHCAGMLAETGDTVLLAPACASYDQYPDYQARGDHFAREVEALML